MSSLGWDICLDRFVRLGRSSAMRVYFRFLSIFAIINHYFRI
jgi:hypothetical protein